MPLPFLLSGISRIEIIEDDLVVRTKGITLSTELLENDSSEEAASIKPSDREILLGEKLRRRISGLLRSRNFAKQLRQPGREDDVDHEG